MSVSKMRHLLKKKKRPFTFLLTSMSAFDCDSLKDPLQPSYKHKKLTKKLWHTLSQIEQKEKKIS